MHVASQRQNPSPSSLMREPLLMRHPSGLCPTAVHFLAMIPTKWGMCGVVWKCHEQPAGMASDFAEKPANALLCRLVPPGLTIVELRRQMLAAYPLCNEV